MEGVADEEGGVGLEVDVGAVLVVGGCGGIGLQYAAAEDERAYLAFAVGAHLEVGAEGVDRLDTDAVESDTLLESLGVVLASGVEHRYGLDEFALGNAAAVVAYGDAQIVVDIDLDALAGVHLELVDGVVDDFLEQYVDAVLGQVAVTQSADIHAGSGAHVLHV